jgi:hypothetical protein
MSLERRITHAAAKAAVAWSNGDEDQAQYWEAQAILLMDERDAQRPGFGCAPVSFYARPANA